MNSKKLIQSIKKDLRGPTPGASLSARYVGAQKHPARKKDEQSKLTFWGHSSPRNNDLAKRDWVFLKNISAEQKWKVWLDVWKSSPIFDIKSIALTWMGHPKQKELRKKKSKDLFDMAIDIDNWAHSDALSSLLAELLEENPKYFSIYRKWNRSKNPWLRRQSIVGIYCYARLRKKHFPAKQAIHLIESLLTDKHFYVQRGVGWTLREIDRVDSRLQRNFVKKNLHRISSIAWFATSELYSPNLRNKLVLKRKSNRLVKGKLVN